MTHWRKGKVTIQAFLFEKVKIFSQGIKDLMPFLHFRIIEIRIYHLQ